MTQPIPCSNTNVDKKIKPEQLTQIIDAILDGKYSWACVLLLRFTGENPLHYIPYRTYNRLVKEERQVGTLSRHEISKINISNQSSETKVDGKSSRKCLSQITDLAYLEAMSEQRKEVRGGNLNQWLGEKIREYSSLKLELVPPKNQRFFS